MSETPQLEWANLPQLLPLCIEFADKKHAGETIDLHEAVERIGNELGIEDVNSFALNKFKNAMPFGDVR